MIRPVATSRTRFFIFKYRLSWVIFIRLLDWQGFESIILEQHHSSLHFADVGVLTGPRNPWDYPSKQSMTTDKSKAHKSHQLFISFILFLDWSLILFIRRCCCVGVAKSYCLWIVWSCNTKSPMANLLIHAKRNSAEVFAVKMLSVV